MDIIDRIRESLSPHLATLGEIEKEADRDVTAGTDSLARFIASLIRDGAASTELREIREQLARIEHNQEKIMSQQDDLNQVGTQIEADVTAINAGIASVGAEIAALEQAAGSGQPLDFTSVNQALSDLSTATASVTAAGAEVPPAAPPADGSDGSVTPSA